MKRTLILFLILPLFIVFNGCSSDKEKSEVTTPSGLKYVDEVIIFNEEDELRLIVANIKPKFMFKGKEYEGRRITGQDKLESYGGQVIFIPEYKDWHSTGLIDLLMELK